MRLILLLLLQIQSIGHARFLKPEEASFKVLFSKSHLKVKADYTFEFKHDFKIKILTEQALDQFKIYSFSYVSDAEELEVQSIKIKNGYKSKEIPSSSYEFKDLSSGAKGFDSTKTIRVPLDGLRVGSEIHIKVLKKTLKPNVKDFFATDYSFGVGTGYVLNQSLSVNSEVPLNFNLHDPHKIIKVSKPQHSNKSFTFTLKKPFVFYFTDEPGYTNVSKISSTVSLSSQKTWTDFSKLYTKNLPIPTKEEEKIIESFIPIDKNLKTKQKIEKVISNIISKVSYLGDWKTVKGRYTPRSISKIIESGHGDCKDNSYLLKAVLNKMGIEAGLALINRANVPAYSVNKDLPRIEEFNHMISWYKDEGQIYFIDATNKSAESTNIPTDIAGRPVLVLENKSGYLSETPMIDASSNTFESTQTINMENEKKAKFRGDVKIKGPLAMRWRNYLKSKMEAEQSQGMLDSFFVKSRFYSHTIEELPEINAAGSSKFLFKVKGDIKPRTIKTSQGMALYPRLYQKETIPVGTFSKERNVDYYLGTPYTTTNNLILKNFKLKGKIPKDCSFKNEYYEFTRKITYSEKKRELKQTDMTRVLKSTIPANELKTNSKLYKALPKYELCSESIAYMY